MNKNFKERGYHPVYVGEIYNGKYLVLRMLGFGGYGSVWLVVDIRTDHHYAMKVLNASVWLRQRTGGLNELQILEILRFLKPGIPVVIPPGLRSVPALLDGFMVSSTTGKHYCLVLEVMGETLYSFAGRFPDRKLPVVLVKRFVKQLLDALELAHERGVVHTDVKPDNIMLPLMDPERTIKAWLDDTVIKGASFSTASFKARLQGVSTKNETAVGCQAARPRVDIWSDAAAFDRFGRRHGIHSGWRSVEPNDHRRSQLERYHRQDLKGKSAQAIAEDPIISNLNVKLIDWGLARWSSPQAPRPHHSDISANLYRSPEAVLGAGWTSKTDIWSLGVMVVELLGGFELFDTEGVDREYDELQHLYEMTGVLWNAGIPQPLLDQARKKSEKTDVLEHLNDEGMVDGYPHLRTYELRWRDPLFEGPGGPFEGDVDDQRKYFTFITNMLQLDPEVRFSAEQLLKQPWLEGV
ncbi:hypothetical protein BLS_007774 [Venturia inaequalis]|uniref:non-specific serine/threonine protein kinase n=1 Tax=Venturia inaequalis TaxID=5025 RepID=A0A8H3UY71_VENIN|nr:hypothetical protein BLS_007774 [Venturia inaequalis]KAE9976662.1 hypothetical protein EG327_007975 [Venturia inaequalis]KAE9978736.1 hypothetical protein EG328_001334 [Venturia inaequalis]